MRPSWSTQCPLSALRQRAFLYQYIRTFFRERNVLEVETPVMSSYANTDVQIDVFSTQGISDAHDKAYLRTSPEFFHKRLLASGFGDLFEIAKVFRQGEQSGRHNPEFSMLEWYRLDFSLADLMNEVAELMLHLLALYDHPKAQVTRISYRLLYQQYLSIDPLQLGRDELNSLCQEKGYYGDRLTFDQALDFLFGVVISTQLPKDELIFVYHFPASQAALAQINPEDNQTCLRFELMWQGIELANGYQELTDMNEQMTRFICDNETRKKIGKKVLPFDQHLLDAMGAGLPACSGVALGLDRLLMNLLEVNTVSDVLPFPAHSA